MPKNRNRNVKCSFCGKPQAGVKRIIAGPGVYICDECISVCRNILDEDELEDEDLEYNIDEQEKELPNPEISLLNIKCLVA